MRLLKYFSCPLFLIFFISTIASASGNIWVDEPAQKTSLTGAKFNPKAQLAVPSTHRLLRADFSKLKEVMFAAPLASSLKNGIAPQAEIDLPLPDGEIHTFIIEESPILADGLLAKFPELKTYRVYSAQDKAIYGRLDILPTGFHAYLTTDKGTVIIDPEQGSVERYRSFYKNSGNNPRQFSCGAKPAAQSFVNLTKTENKFQKSAARNSGQLLSYRLAVATTVEYSTKVASGNISNTQAAIVTTINRVNAIYERDLGIQLKLVVDNGLISTDSNDFDNTDPDDILNKSKLYIDVAVGVSNYDIGHVFSTGAGGLATLGAVCDDTYKAEGVTGIFNPVGDAFDIDYVAHEIGHQFGATHTFNGTTDSCGGINRNAATAFEPGSGSTIMAYAGICGAENVQLSATSAGGASEDTFHAGSINQIVSFTRNGVGSTCDAPLPNNGNTAPTASAGVDYTIPQQTPFELKGSATDINADTLTYQWDEMDVGTESTFITYGTDLGDNALFRSFAPSSNPVRTFPRIATLISGLDDNAEHLPTTDRTLNFRLTVRDQNRGVHDDDMRITVDKNVGPFKVLSAVSTVTLDVTQPQVLEWDAACTAMAPVSCANVDILLSTDSGATFQAILLGTANDGEETVSFPAVNSNAALVKIACTDNIFFDVNDSLIALRQGSGSVLVSTGAGSTGGVCTPVSSGGGGGGGSLNIWLLVVLLMCRNLFRKIVKNSSVAAYSKW